MWCYQRAAGRSAREYGNQPRIWFWGIWVMSRKLLFQGAPRGKALTPRSGRTQLPQIYLTETSRAPDSVYHPDQRGGTRLRWLISTCLAAAFGVLAIGVAMVNSMDRGESSILFYIEKSMRQSMLPGAEPPPTIRQPGQVKADRLTVAARGATTKKIIQDSVQDQRAGRNFIVIKPYARLSVSLTGNPAGLSDQIPPFNPFTLYANAQGAGAADETGSTSAGTATVAVRDPDGLVLPVQDNLELSQAEVLAIVLKDRDTGLEEAPMDDTGTSTDGGGEGESGPAEAEHVAAVPAEPLPPNTIAIAKTVSGDQSAQQFEGEEVRVILAKAGDSLSGLLKHSGVDGPPLRAIVTAARKIVPDETLAADQELRLVMAPVDDGDPQAMLVTLFSEGHSHLVTVARTPTGEYRGSENPLAANLTEQGQERDGGQQQNSLYTSLFGQALAQGLPPDMIMRVIRTFAYDTDFRRRVSPGDQFEAFYDITGEERAGQSAMPGHPDQLLYIALTVGGETRKFFRFRTQDGLVDYYDAQGSNAKKFLMRRPVRGDVRFTSGFGFRMHPLLHIKKMHTGIDWAGAPGTPVIAAGTGVIAELGRKGGNGNYIRIRHANGYETAYSHMLKFQPGLTIGSKVNQSDVIGFMGTTGLSTGTHLHFEVLINSTFVDPMTIHVPREHQLAGRQLADFQKERGRVEELMNRTPVTSLVDQPGNSKG